MKHAIRAFALICVVISVVAAVIVFGELHEPQDDRPPHADGPPPLAAMYDQSGLQKVQEIHDFVEGVLVGQYLDALHQAELAARQRGGGGPRGSCDRPAYERPPEEDGKYAIPLEIVERESGGNYGSCNESSGACGAYQALDSTWDGYAGFTSACDAPPDVQDQWAAEARAARGCAPWASTC